MNKERIRYPRIMKTIIEAVEQSDDKLLLTVRKKHIGDWFIGRVGDNFEFSEVGEKP